MTKKKKDKRKQRLREFDFSLLRITTEEGRWNNKLLVLRIL